MFRFECDNIDISLVQLRTHHEIEAANSSASTSLSDVWGWSLLDGAVIPQKPRIAGKLLSLEHLISNQSGST